MHPSPASATQNISPWNSHSHYVSGYNPSAYYNQGVADAQFDVAHCTPGSGDNRSAVKMAILDYGQPRRLSTSYGPYYGYGTMTIYGQAMYDDQIVYQTEQYSQGYLTEMYVSGNTCIRLRVAMGINNSQMCNNPPNLPGQNGCTRTQAGQTWGDAVAQYCLWLSQNNYGPYISCGAGGDFETNSDTYPSGNFQWDNYTATNQWEQGFLPHNTYQATFYDFGDSATRPNDWSTQNVFAIGYSNNPVLYTIPEIYNPCTTTDWTGGNTFGQQCRNFSIEGINGGEFFPGELTECHTNADGSVPPGNWPQAQCGTPSAPEFGPRQAWDDLFAMQNFYYSYAQLGTLDYATNIV